MIKTLHSFSSESWDLIVQGAVYVQVQQYIIPYRPEHNPHPVCCISRKEGKNVIIVANSSALGFFAVHNKVQESRKQKGFTGDFCAQLEDSFLFLSSNVMLADHKLDPRIVLFSSSWQKIFFCRAIELIPKVHPLQF